MNNYLVFREEGLNNEQIAHRYEHNERTADRYNNTNIKIELSADNYYFKKPAKSYEYLFQDLVDEGKINTKGLKPDANHFSEIIVGINREYWKDKTAEYIQQFFQTAYDHIAKQFGEDMILSAVLHLDEIDKDGFQNIHMHIVAIPTVEKRRYYTKRSKEYKALAEEVGEKNIKTNDERLLKEVERQVSHSKFFESQKDENHRMVYSYSIWQDAILDALKRAGFTGIHRGLSNQKAVHIHPSAFKNMMERIKCKADGLIEDITAEPFGTDHYIIKKQDLDTVFSAKESVEMEMATFDEALEALQTEQAKVYNRQNEVYQVALRQQEAQIEIDEAERLKVEADRLREENKQLKEILRFLKEKVSEVLLCFKSVIDNWKLLRNPDTDKQQLFGVLDFQIQKGNSLLYGEPEQLNNIPTR